MVQVLPQKQMSPFGQILGGFAQGLSDTLPKIMEQKRLASGLKQFEQDAPNLSPMQQITRLSSIPGVTPQMIQTLGELSKHEGRRNAFMQRGGQKPSAQSDQLGQEYLEELSQKPTSQSPAIKQQAPEAGGQQIHPGSPVRQEAMPVAPWSPQRRDQEISKIIDNDPYISIDEARNVAANNESRELSQYKSQQEKDSYLQGQRKLFDDELSGIINTQLQTDNQSVFKDIEGPMLQNTKEAAYKDLAANPNKTPHDIAKKWADRLLDTAKTKTQLNVLANRDIWDQMTKQGETVDKLKAYQKIFSKSGNLEEYFNILKKDFNMSPQGSAQIAYPVSKEVDKHIKGEYALKRRGFIKNAGPERDAMKVALQVENSLQDNDSLLSIAKKLSDLYPEFDQGAFFSQLTQDMDTAGFNSRQRREIAEGKKGMMPSWGDTWFSQFKGKK